MLAVFATMAVLLAWRCWKTYHNDTATPGTLNPRDAKKAREEIIDQAQTDRQQSIDSCENDIEKIQDKFS